MKIAIQISGTLADIQQSYISLQKMLPKHHTYDVFIATIDDLQCDIKELAWYKRFDDNDFRRSGAYDLIDRYKNTRITVCSGYRMLSMTRNIICALFLKHQCSLLRQQSNIIYDAILCTRSDIIYAEPFVDSVFTYSQDCVLIPYCSDWHNGLNDQFCVGHTKLIDMICDEFTYLETYLAEQKNSHPECLLKRHVISQKIPVRRFLYTYQMRGKPQYE